MSSYNSRPSRLVSQALKDVSSRTDDSDDDELETQQATKQTPVKETPKTPKAIKPAPRIEQEIEQEEDDYEDIAPEGLKLLTVGALVEFTNREKIKGERVVNKALEKLDSGTVKIGTDIPKYIATQFSYLAKQAGLSQKDYVLKLLLEDMFRRGVFEEPKAN